MAQGDVNIRTRPSCNLLQYLTLDIYIAALDWLSSAQTLVFNEHFCRRKSLG